jgi:hypothetical protein
MGRKIQRARLAQLDTLGEEAVFRCYLEEGSVVAMCAELFEPTTEDAKRWGTDELYRWLHAGEGRWERWQKVRELRGHVELDMVLDEAMKATPENANAQRIKVDALKYRSGVLNRDLNPSRPNVQVNVGVQVGMAWLQAMKVAE